MIETSGLDGRYTTPTAATLRISTDFETAEGQIAARDGLREKLVGSKPAEIKAQCIETLRQAGVVVAAKAPGEAVAFKGWLYDTSQHVARRWAVFRSRHILQPTQSIQPSHRTGVANGRYGA